MPKVEEDNLKMLDSLEADLNAWSAEHPEPPVDTTFVVLPEVTEAPIPTDGPPHPGELAVAPKPTDGEPATHEDVQDGVEQTLLGAHLTDRGNALRFVALYGRNVRHCWPWRSWLIWDGRRFKVDKRGRIFRIGKTVAEQIDRAAWKHLEGDRKELLVKHALRLEKEHNLREMISSARSEKGVAILPSKLDSQTMLCNATNGVIDLRTGELRPHDQKHLMTKIAAAEYHPDATCPVWEGFLEDTTGGDEQLEHFLQVIAGYALTGDVSEERFFFVYGPTNSGKSTFLEALGRVFGDYATTSDFETFLSSDFVQGGRPRSDLARLDGVRFVRSSEPGRKGRSLDEGLLKKLTGGEEINASRKYENEFAFQPKLKLFLASNDAPDVRDDDDAMWRRLLRVPFSHEVPEEKRKKSVKRALTTSPQSQAAILAWTVRGCIAWKNEGLQIPGAVEQSTVEYRHEVDPLRDFIEDRCIAIPQAWVSNDDLRPAYVEWCKVNGVKPKSARAFGKRLARKGFTPERTMTARGWRGIALKEI